jgi:hypothetical protein BACCOPRO_02155
VTGVRPLFLFLLVFIQSSTGFYEFCGTGRCRAVGYDIEIIDRNAIGAYPVEYMADSSDVKRWLTTRDIEMVDMPDMPQQGAYMFQGNIHMLGVSPHTVGTAHVTAPGNLDT